MEKPILTPVEKQLAYLKKRISPCGNSVEKCGLLASGHVLPMKDFFTEISRAILDPVEKPISPLGFFQDLFTEFSRRFSRTQMRFFKVVFTEVFTTLFAGASGRPNLFFHGFSHGCFPAAGQHLGIMLSRGGPRARGPVPGPQAKVHFPCAGIVAKCVSCESSIAAPLVSGNLMTTTMTACFAPVNRKHSSHKMNVSH